MDFTNKTIVNAMKSDKYGPRLNAIKHEVDSLTSAARAVSAETAGLTDTGTMMQRIKRSARVIHLEKQLKKLQKRGDRLQQEWNTLLNRYWQEVKKA